MYSVVMLLEDGDYKILETCDEYDDADEAFDTYSNKYPNAWIEILENMK